MPSKFIAFITALASIGSGFYISGLFGGSVFTWAIGGVLILFGLSCLRTGMFGSKKLLDDMTHNKRPSDESKREWRNIHE